jgi:hypothetical protein
MAVTTDKSWKSMARRAPHGIKLVVALGHTFDPPGRVFGKRPLLEADEIGLTSAPPSLNLQEESQISSPGIWRVRVSFLKNAL